MFISSVLVVVLLLTAAFAFMFVKLAVRQDERYTAQWLENFSMENFEPMERLLDKSDFEFLSQQPGYKPEIGARLLKERKKLFLGYLSTLTGDFNELLRIARLIIVHSSEDRADFAKALWRQQITFYFAVVGVRVRVALYPFGWTSLDVSRLVQALQTMRNQVAELGVQPMAASHFA
jgi:hypothetical protein